MIEILKAAAKEAWRAGVEHEAFVTIEIEPAGVCVRGANSVRSNLPSNNRTERATWEQIKANPNLLIVMVSDVAEHYPRRGERRA